MQWPAKSATTYAPVDSAAYWPLQVAFQGKCRVWLGYHVLEAGLGNSFPGRHRRAGCQIKGGGTCATHNLLLGWTVRLEQKSILRTKWLEMRQI